MHYLPLSCLHLWHCCIFKDPNCAGFLLLYPDAKILPKLHFLVHYPTQIERYGPLIHSWTMRHEAKLSYVKRSSCRGNFKNIPLTVGKKHQLWTCYQLQSQSHLLFRDPETSPNLKPSQMDCQSIHVQEELLKHVTTLTPQSIINHPKWIKVQGLAE